VPDVKLACRRVWKLYGPDAGRFLATHPDASTEAIRAAGLVPAVAAADLEIASGEIFVIMGLSGSGKSTLVRCLSRLIEPTGGEILFEGRDLLAMTRRELIDLRRHKMGMVFQHFALLPHLSVLGNVAFPLAIQGIAREQCHARAREMIALVGLEGREDHFPRQLSGGQQQRVGIARALAQRPSVMLADEPVASLDPPTSHAVMRDLKRIAREDGITTIVNLHFIDMAREYADRIIGMRDGLIVFDGTAADATDQVFEDIYGRPIDEDRDIRGRT
jgi:glycine betaine/proline transport system ATP-binding protein